MPKDTQNKRWAGSSRKTAQRKRRMSIARYSSSHPILFIFDFDGDISDPDVDAPSPVHSN